MSQDKIVQEAVATVAAWRLLEAAQEKFRRVASPEGWDVAMEHHRAGLGDSPQVLRRSLLKELRAAEAKFWSAMKALEKAVD